MLFQAKRGFVPVYEGGLGTGFCQRKQELSLLCSNVPVLGHYVYGFERFSHQEVRFRSAKLNNYKKHRPVFTGTTGTN